MGVKFWSKAAQKRYQSFGHLQNLRQFLDTINRKAFGDMVDEAEFGDGEMGIEPGGLEAMRRTRSQVVPVRSGASGGLTRKMHTMPPRAGNRTLVPSIVAFATRKTERKKNVLPS